MRYDVRCMVVSIHCERFNEQTHNRELVCVVIGVCSVYPLAIIHIQFQYAIA